MTTLTIALALAVITILAIAIVAGRRPLARGLSIARIRGLDVQLMLDAADERAACPAHIGDWGDRPVLATHGTPMGKLMLGEDMVYPEEFLKQIDEEEFYLICCHAEAVADEVDILPPIRIEGGGYTLTRPLGGEWVLLANMADWYGNEPYLWLLYVWLEDWGWL